MSGRGGGRGRGRGGPSTGRGGMFMTGSSLMGGFSFTEVIEAGKEELKKSLFPKQGLPDWQEPTHREQRGQRYYQSYLKQLRFSAYHVAIPEEKDAGTVKYSDRYEDPVEKLPSLADAEQKARLNAEFFPNLTWKAFFDGERRSTRKKHKKVAKATKDVVGGEEGADGEDDAKDNDEQPRSGDEKDEEEADEFDDEEENRDYDNNYFDAGEDSNDDGIGDGGDEGGEY